MLSKLKWDIAAVTPQDFLQLILVRLPIDRNTWDAHMIHRHAQTFIALSTRGEYITSLIFSYIIKGFTAVERSSARMGRNFGGRYERLFGRLRHGWKDTPGRRELFVTK